jgi:hypothetical protein
MSFRFGAHGVFRRWALLVVCVGAAVAARTAGAQTFYGPQPYYRPYGEPSFWHEPGARRAAIASLLREEGYRLWGPLDYAGRDIIAFGVDEDGHKTRFVIDPEDFEIISARRVREQASRSDLGGDDFDRPHGAPGARFSTPEPLPPERGWRAPATPSPSAPRLRSDAAVQPPARAATQRESPGGAPRALNPPPHKTQAASVQPHGAEPSSAGRRAIVPAPAKAQVVPAAPSESSSATPEPAAAPTQPVAAPTAQAAVAPAVVAPASASGADALLPPLGRISPIVRSAPQAEASSPGGVDASASAAGG